MAGTLAGTRGRIYAVPFRTHSYSTSDTDILDVA